MNVEPALDTAQLKEALTSSFPGGEFPDIEAVTPKGVVLRAHVTEMNTRPGGTISGPTVMTLVDTAAYLTLLSRVGLELLAVTTSLHIDFVRKPAVADLIVSTDIVKLGRRLAVFDVTVHSDGTDGPVAKALVTYSRVP